VCKRRLVSYGPNNLWDLCDDHFAEKITGGSSWVRGSDEGAHHGDTIKSFGRRAS